MTTTNTEPWRINEAGCVVYRLNDHGNRDDILIRQAEGEYHDKEKIRSLGQQVLILLNSVPSRVTPEMWMALGKGQALIDRTTQSAQERKLLTEQGVTEAEQSSGDEPTAEEVHERILVEAAYRRVLARSGISDNTMAALPKDLASAMWLFFVHGYKECHATSGVIEASRDEVMKTQFVKFVKQLEAQVRATQAWVAQYDANRDEGSKKNAAHSLGRIAGMMVMYAQLFGSEEKFELPEPVRAAIDAQNEDWAAL